MTTAPPWTCPPVFLSSRAEMGVERGGEEGEGVSPPQAGIWRLSFRAPNVGRGLQTPTAPARRGGPPCPPGTLSHWERESVRARRTPCPFPQGSFWPARRLRPYGLPASANGLSLLRECAVPPVIPSRAGGRTKWGGGQGIWRLSFPPVIPSRAGGRTKWGGGRRIWPLSFPPVIAS